MTDRQSTTLTARRGILGIIIGLAAGFAFGAGGTIVKPLFAEGWSPGAAVFGRLLVAAIVLALPALIAVRFDLRPLLRAWRLVLAYSVLAVAGVQLAFYAAIERIPVSIGLLVEYLAPVALLLLAWVRTRRTPHRLVLIGAALAMVGLVLVIGPNGSEPLDVLGIGFALIAMVGVAFYYIVGDATPPGVPPMTLAWAGFVIGGAALGLAGLVGILPMTAGFGEVAFFGMQTPWWVPLVSVGVLSTAFAYVSGITAITMLGTRLASFLGLSEVIFAGIVAWIVLGEEIAPVALLGAALILAGIVFVRFEPSAADVAAMPEPVTAPIEVIVPEAPRASEAPVFEVPRASAAQTPKQSRGVDASAPRD